MQHTADRIRVPDFRFFVVALKLQRRTGGSLAETLTNLSAIIRRRKEIRLKARALTSEVESLGRRPRACCRSSSAACCFSSTLT